MIIDFCGNGEALKDLSEEFPDKISVVLLEAFVIESIEFVDLSVLMVAPQNCDSTFILDFQQQDVKEGLHAVEASVDVVPHEKIVCALSQIKCTGSFPQISKISRRS